MGMSRELLLLCERFRLNRFMIGLIIVRSESPMAWRIVFIHLLLLSASPLQSAEREHASLWRDTPINRVKALALLETVHADLLMARSATLVLEAWCQEHHQASEPKIRAIRDVNRQKPAPAEVQDLLKLTPQETIRYRSVQLVCGTHVFSEADNWYVPERLTPGMNEILDTTDTPFGVAVKDLHFSRRTIGAERLWTPLEKGWEMKMPAFSKTRRFLQIPSYVLHFRAVLSSANNATFSVVDETYRNDLFDFRLSQ